MHEVLVERPRTGWRRPYRERRLAYERATRSRDGEASLPARMPMRFERTKHLNENLRPFARFLRSRVGARWVDVFREICANIRLTNAVQRHVREHLDDMVLFARREGERVVLVSARGGRYLDPEVLPDGRVLGWSDRTLGGTLYVDFEGVLRSSPSGSTPVSVAPDRELAPSGVDRRAMTRRRRRPGRA